MKQKFGSPLALVCIGLLSACGGEAALNAGDGPGAHELPGTFEAATGGEDTQEEMRGEPLELELIAELDVDGNTHRFLDAGGSIVISVEGQVQNGPPAAALLEAQHGPLTSLEKLLALAPDAVQIDERWLEAHTREAESLGRVDDSVRSVALAAPAATEKSKASCESVAANVAFFAGNAYFSSNSKATRQDTESITTGINKKPKAVAVCNDAATPVLQLYGHWDLRTGGVWYSYGFDPVGGGTYRYFWWPAESSTFTLRATGTVTCETPQLCAEWEANPPWWYLGAAW